MKNFDIKVVGYLTIHAETEDEALDKFEEYMKTMKVADLRTKQIFIEENI